MKESFDITLPNGYVAELLKNSDFTIDEIWKKEIYKNDYTFKNNDIIVDLGANQGLFSLYAAFHGALVYACELVQGHVVLLRENIEKNSLHS